MTIPLATLHSSETRALVPYPFEALLITSTHGRPSAGRIHCEPGRPWARTGLAQATDQPEVTKPGLRPRGGPRAWPHPKRCCGR